MRMPRAFSCTLRLVLRHANSIKTTKTLSCGHFRHDNATRSMWYFTKLRAITFIVSKTNPSYSTPSHLVPSHTEVIAHLYCLLPFYTRRWCLAKHLLLSNTYSAFHVDPLPELRSVPKCLNKHDCLGHHPLVIIYYLYRWPLLLKHSVWLFLYMNSVKYAWLSNTEHSEFIRRCTIYGHYCLYIYGIGRGAV